MSLTIEAGTPMQAILDAYPSARRALFQRYHVGGCNACGFQPTDTLAEVCRDHNILDVDEVIAHIQRSDEVDRSMRIEAAAVRSWIEDGSPLRFLDVRMPPEQAADPVPEAEALDFTNSQSYLELPKDTRIVFLCQDGDRSIDTAAYFVGHGFTHAFSLLGGVDAWRAASASH